MNDKDKAQFEEGWAMLDKNGDGFLEKKEVHEFFKSMMGEMMKSFGATDAELEEACNNAWEGFLAMDANGDGKISKAEMLDFCEKHGNPMGK